MTSPLQPMYQINPGDTVVITATAVDDDVNGTGSSDVQFASIQFLYNMSLGSYAMQSEATFARNPLLLWNSTCPSGDALCLIRANYACNPFVVDSQVTGSAAPCSNWPLNTMSPTASASAQFINGRLFQNRSTIIQSFTYTLAAAAALNVPNPFAQVCLRPRSPATPPTNVPITTPWFDYGNQSCFYLRLYAPPVPLDCQAVVAGFSPRAAPPPALTCGALSLADANLPSEPPGCGPDNWCRWPIQMAIGQTLAARAYFKPNTLAIALNASDITPLSLSSSPGLPNGAAVGPTVAERLALAADLSPAATLAYPIFYRELTLAATLADLQSAAGGAAPAAPIDRIEYSACFQPAPAPGAAATALPAAACPRVAVVRPRPRILVAQTDFPLNASCTAADASGESACDAVRGVTADMAACGPHRRFKAAADGGGGAAARVPQACAPAGEPVDVRVRCTYVWTLTAFDGHTLADSRAGLRSDLYSPALAIDNNPPWPPGAELSPAAAGVTKLGDAGAAPGGEYTWPVTRQVGRPGHLGPAPDPGCG
jgi:hypothetical protein